MTEKTLNLIRTGIRVLGVVSPDTAGQVALNLFTTPRRYVRPKWEMEIMATGRQVRLRSGLNAHIWGDRGPMTMLVHGWEGRGTQLGRLVGPLVENGFRVVALDGPAHGDSPGKRTNIRIFSQAIHQAAEELGPVHSLVAHSFGAGAATLAVANGLSLSRVVLAAAPSDLNWVVDGYCQMMKLDERVANSFNMKLRSWVGLGPEGVDLTRLSARVSVPALIAHDPKDREVPFHNAEALARSWPGAHLLALDNVGHRRILKAPQFLQATLNFIKHPESNAVES